MKLKIIEHKKYTAPGGKRRKFEQQVQARRATPAPAARYVPHQSMCELGPTFIAHDRMVLLLLTHGRQNPSAMAKRKYHPHRPKPANNTAKNRARRHSDDLILGSKTPGNHPEPAIRINAAQVRHDQALFGGMDMRLVRSVTMHRKLNRGDSVAQHRRKARKSARRAKHKRRA